MAVFLEAQRLRLAGFDDGVPLFLIVAELIPTIVGGHEQESQIVHFAIVFARLQRKSVADSLLQPIFLGSGIAAILLVKNPHHAGKKAVAPMRPGRTFMLPPAVVGVHRIEVRMGLDQFADLLLGEPECIVKKLPVCFKDELNHYLWILAVGCGG